MPAISKDEELELIQRLYDRPIELHEQLMKDLDNRFYPTAPPTTISEDALKSSVTRQVDDEVERRKQHAQQYDDHAYGPIEKDRQHVTLSASEIDESVERLYTQSIERKKESKERSNKRYLFDQSLGIPGKKKSIGGKELKESAVRLSVPKKTKYTIEEINKIYQLSDQ